MSLTQDKELCSKALISSFKELDTGQGTLLQIPCFIFFNELDTRQGTMLHILYYILRSLKQDMELYSISLV